MITKDSDPDKGNFPGGESNHNSIDPAGQKDKGQYINLLYLRQQTRGNIELMKRMITLYLSQTPELLGMMKKGIEEKNWEAVQTAVHKMIPSFWIMGIDPQFETMAKTLKDDALKKEHLDEIPPLFAKLQERCLLACGELEEAVTTLV